MKVALLISFAVTQLLAPASFAETSEMLVNVAIVQTHAMSQEGTSTYTETRFDIGLIVKELNNDLHLKVETFAVSSEKDGKLKEVLTREQAETVKAIEIRVGRAEHKGALVAASITVVENDGIYITEDYRSWKGDEKPSDVAQAFVDLLRHIVFEFRSDHPVGETFTVPMRERHMADISVSSQKNPSEYFEL